MRQTVRQPRHRLADADDVAAWRRSNKGLMTYPTWKDKQTGAPRYGAEIVAQTLDEQGANDEVGAGRAACCPGDGRSAGRAGCYCRRGDGQAQAPPRQEGRACSGVAINGVWIVRVQGDALNRVYLATWATELGLTALWNAAARGEPAPLWVTIARAGDRRRTNRRCGAARCSFASRSSSCWTARWNDNQSGVDALRWWR
jgi:hypothetical protein